MQDSEGEQYNIYECETLQRFPNINYTRSTSTRKNKNLILHLCTPECARFIDQYLEWRQRLGEQLKPDSPLLRISFDSVIQINRPKTVSSTVVGTMIFSLLDTTGVRAPSETGKRTELMLTHGFRKFFKTTCINAGMNPLYYLTAFRGFGGNFSRKVHELQSVLG